MFDLEIFKFHFKSWAIVLLPEAANPSMATIIFILALLFIRQCGYER